MRGLRLVALGALVLFCCGAALAADDANVVRVNLNYSFPSGSQDALGYTFEADNAFGASASYERRVSDLVGIQFGLGWTDYDVKEKGNGIDQKIGTETTWPISVMLLFHPLKRDAKIDWYIGPGIAYVLYDDFQPEREFAEASTTIDDQATFTLRTGLDFKFGNGNWALNVDVQYFYTAAQNALQYSIGSDYIEKDVPINPYVAGVGFAVRF
jgi:outer membrane protein W